MGMKLLIVMFLVNYVYFGPGEVRAEPSEFCTGNFKEKDLKDAGNKMQRPDAGTECEKDCVYDEGRWGGNYCWTNTTVSQWGAECLWCQRFICENNDDCLTGEGEICNKNENAKKG